MREKSEMKSFQVQGCWKRNTRRCWGLIIGLAGIMVLLEEVDKGKVWLSKVAWGGRFLYSLS